MHSKASIFDANHPVYPPHKVVLKMLNVR